MVHTMSDEFMIGRCVQQVVPFVVIPSTASLSHREPAFAGIRHDTCRDEEHDKRATCIEGLFAPQESDVTQAGISWISA